MIPEFYSAIQDQLNKELPFAVYRKPGTTFTTAIFQEDDNLNVVKDFSETGFVFSPFDTDRPSYFLKPDKVINDSSIYKLEPTKPKQKRILDSEGKELYKQLVNRAIAEIKKGTFEKVVLSRSIETGCSVNPLELLRSLFARYDSALCYLWYHPNVGMWLGATPEILLRIKADQLTTISLAGTKSYVRGSDPEWGKKEKEEQRLVTDYIERALKDNVHKLEVSETESVRAGNLWHLRTRLSGLIKSELPQIIGALHPTPAVCGLPMHDAKKFILDNEQYQRKFYTGFLGELNLGIGKESTSSQDDLENNAGAFINNTTELFVNLRCLQLENNKATVYVGGGVTIDSIPEKEWEETVAKSYTMLDLLIN